MSRERIAAPRVLDANGQVVGGDLQRFLDRLASVVNEVSTSISAAAATNEIVRNILGAAQRADEVSENIVEVTRGIERTRAAALSVLDIARGLSEQPGALSNKVDGFVSGL